MANDVFNAAALDKKVDEELKGEENLKKTKVKKRMRIFLFIYL